MWSRCEEEEELKVCSRSIGKEMRRLKRRTYHLHKSNVGIGIYCVRKTISISTHGEREVNIINNILPLTTPTNMASESVLSLAGERLHLAASASNI